MKIIEYTLTLMILLFTVNCRNDLNRDNYSSCKVFTIQLKGRQYKELSLKADISGPTHSSIIRFYQGRSIGNQTWEFNVPDSIIDRSENFTIITKPFDFSTNTFFCAKFKNAFKNDPRRFDYIYDKNGPNINANYIETYQHFGKKGDENYFIVNDTIILDGISRSEDIYELQSNKVKETEIQLSMKFPDFGFIDTSRYETSISKMDSIVHMYPDSKYLMDQFYQTYKQVKMVDAISIYRSFSENNMTTGFGKDIGESLNLYLSPFKNTTLINSETSLPEPMVVDSNKINLLIFSASWCRACHELIPAIKEIYGDLYPNLEITYVSMDELKYHDAWKKLLHDFKIPWRSISAYGHIKEIESRYDATSLPHMLLILSNMTVKKIDIRNKEDKNEIYLLVNQIKY